MRGRSYNGFFRLVIVVGLIFTAPGCKEKKIANKSPVLHIAVTDLHYNYSWDIHKIRGLYTHLISYLISEPPIRMKTDGSYHPSIFKKWSFSEDKRTLVVQVSDKFTFHDGTPIKTDDVLFALSKALNRSNAQGGHNDLMNNLCAKKKCDITKIDKNTLQFRFKRYASAILPSFTLSELSIFPSSYYDHADKKKILGNLSGPYKVVSFTPKLMKLKAQKSHHLISEKSPKFIHIHEVKEPEIRNFFVKHENAVVYSAFANRAANLNLPDSKLKVLPPMIAEVIQINRFSKRFKKLKDRKRIASKIYRSLKMGTQVKKFTKKADQYFPNYSIAHVKDVDSFYEQKFGPDFDNIEIATYEELGFDEVFSELKINSLKNSLAITTKVLDKNSFFSQKNSSNNNSNEQLDAFYYFSGVGASDPIFEMTYMIERTNGGRYATDEILSLLKQARFEKDKFKYHAYLKEIQSTLLSSYLMVPVRHSSPVFHYKGIFQPSADFYSGNLDFWAWQRDN